MVSIQCFYYAESPSVECLQTHLTSLHEEKTFPYHNQCDKHDWDNFTINGIA